MLKFEKKSVAKRLKIAALGLIGWTGKCWERNFFVPLFKAKNIIYTVIDHWFFFSWVVVVVLHYLELRRFLEKFLTSGSS